jgi:hypothetical protein
MVSERVTLKFRAQIPMSCLSGANTAHEGEAKCDTCESTTVSSIYGKAFTVVAIHGEDITIRDGDIVLTVRKSQLSPN